MRTAEEDGTAIVEFVWLAILLLVPLLYVVLSVFAVQRTAYAASAAARSASRAFVTAPDSETGRLRALASVRMVLADQDLAPGTLTVRIRCSQVPCLSPGSVVTVDLTGAARLPLLPAFLGSAAPRISISAEHSSPYGQFREARP